MGILRCGSRTSLATDTMGVSPRYAKMMPPAEIAASTPAMPDGANPCTLRLSALKCFISNTITRIGTRNLKMLTMLLASAKVLTLK